MTELYKTFFKKQKLDFRTKFFTTLVLSYVMLLGNLQQSYLIVAIIASIIPYLLIATEKRYGEAIKGILFISFAALVQKYLLLQSSGIIASFFLFITMLFLKMLPGLVMGKYTLISTDMSDLVYSLKKMKIPDFLTIPITVMARFFYTVHEDYGQIKDAMYLHGLTTRKLLLTPWKLFEYRIIPLLMCLTRTADEVSISAMTRGLEVNKQRSSISTTKIKTIDYIFFILTFLLIYFYLRGKYA